MTPEQRAVYVRHRFERARETLDEARLLAGAGRLHGAVNRAYYAMFYAVSALALRHGFSTRSHTQLRGFFNREFVKAGAISIDLGRAYGAAFDSRTKGDYDDLTQFTREQVELMLNEAERLIVECQALAALEESPDET